jgi:methylmalonyl-CoA mutase
MKIRQIEGRIRSIVEREGRRPRILLAHLESHQSDRWTKPLAAFLAEFGFDVDIGPGNQTPLQTARLAIESDVHMMCVSIADSSNQPLVVELTEALRAKGGDDIRLLAGGAGLQTNHAQLYRAGVDLVANFDKANIDLLDRMLDLLDGMSAKRKP